MKFVCIADIHLSRYSQDKTENEYNWPERVYSIISTLNEVCNYCRINEIKMVVIAGDILHNKSIIYTVAQNILLDFLEKNEDLFFYIIDGNHDLSGKGNDVSSALRSLKHVNNVKWIGFQDTYKLENILFIPYSVDIANIVRKNSEDILISHFGLNEGVLNSGISIISDISLTNLIGKYKLVLLGHYHKPQEIIRDDISLYYTGSIIQLDWGEKNDEKRFLVVDNETLEIESIPTTKYKKHIEIELTPETKSEAILAAKKASESGDYVKVIMTDSTDLSDIKEDFKIIDKTETDITNRGITSSMSQSDRLNKYLEISEIPDEQKQMYLDLGKEIIDACEETI